MPIEIRQLQFQSERLPTRVRLVLSDAERRNESTVWISAQFELGEHGSDRLAMLALAALDELQKLIGQGRENAAREPGTPSR